MLTAFKNIFATPRDLILVVIALWIGLWLAEKRSERHDITVADLNNLTFYPLTGFLLGGRLFFAVENLSAFSRNPASLFSLNMDLFDPYGGMLVAILVAWAYSYRRSLSIWSALDAMTPIFAATAVGIAFSHLATGDAFGKEASLPWSVRLWGAARHPSQVYEILAAIVILGILWYLELALRPGGYFLVFSILTSGFRVFLEAFRGDSTLIAGGLRLEQVLAWCILAVSLCLLERLLENSPKYTEASKHG